METVHEPLDGVNQKSRVARREFMRLGAIGGAAVAAGAVASTWMPDLRKRGLLSAEGVFDAGSIAWADMLYDEVVPDEPVDPEPVHRRVADSRRRWRPSRMSTGRTGRTRRGRAMAGRTRTATRGTSGGAARSAGLRSDDSVGVQDRVEGGRAFVHDVEGVADQSNGLPRDSFDQFGKRVAAGPRYLPKSTIYGFNGTFPGPMINAEYGQPALVRFVNKLGRERKGFGSSGLRFAGPDYTFLTHLHNAHTAPESDGNPHYSMLTRPVQLTGTRPASGVTTLSELAGGWSTRRRSRASSGSTTTAWITPVPMCTRAWSGCIRSTTRCSISVTRPNPTGLRLPGRRTDTTGDGSFDVDVRHPVGVLRRRVG